MNWSDLSIAAIPKRIAKWKRLPDTTFTTTPGCSYGTDRHYIDGSFECLAAAELANAERRVIRAS